MQAQVSSTIAEYKLLRRTGALTLAQSAHPMRAHLIRDGRQPCKLQSVIALTKTMTGLLLPNNYSVSINIFDFFPLFKRNVGALQRNFYKIVLRNSNVFKYLQMSSNVFKYLQMSSNVFKCLQMSSNVFKCLRMPLNVYKCP